MILTLTGAGASQAASGQNPCAIIHLGNITINPCPWLTGPAFDLVPSQTLSATGGYRANYDDNRFPLNPFWAYQAQHPGMTAVPYYDGCAATISEGGPIPDVNCRDQPVSYDPPGFWTYGICAGGRGDAELFHGLVNYVTATYQGRLYWEEHSAAGEDDDYSFNLATPGGNGSVSGNTRGRIHVETDSDDTIGNFQNVPWWHALQDAVNGNHGRANKMVDGHLAVVTGLVGFDVAHTPGTELHPAYAMAINTALDRNPKGETWAYYAENYGDQGFCSSQEQYLPDGSPGTPFGWLALPIPWMPGATDAHVTWDDFSNYRKGGEHVAWAEPGRALEVAVLFPTAASSFEGRYHGVFHVTWDVPAGTPRPRPPRVERRMDRNPDVEEAIAKLMDRLTGRSRQRALAVLRAIPHTVAADAYRVKLAPRRPTRVGAPRGPHRGRSAIAHALIFKTKIGLMALCEGYNGRVPGRPGLCALLNRTGLENAPG